jgi:hypothetical protein
LEIVMALFSRIVRKVHRNGSGRVVIVEHHRAGLPPSFRRLTVLCHNPVAHALPVQLRFSGDAKGRDGRPLAIYTCPYCRSRQAWARDRLTGRPFRLWVRHS